MSGDQGNQHPEFFGVHVLSQPPPRRKVYRTIHKVITLSAVNDPVVMLSESDSREHAVMLPLDDDVLISHDRGELTRPGAAATAALGPKRLTAPWPITDSTQVFVSVPVLAGATSRVLVTEVHCTYTDR